MAFCPAPSPGRGRVTTTIPTDCTNQQSLQRSGAVPDPIWVGSKGLLALPRVPDTPKTLLAQTIFLQCCPRTTTGQHAACLKSVACLLSSPACLCLLILLLISRNVHPNPGPVFPCSVYAENVTWRGRSVQCCTCSKWVNLMCSLLFFLSCYGIFAPLALWRLSSPSTTPSDFARAYPSFCRVSLH